MLVKTLQTKKGLFLEDEIGRFVGYIDEIDFVDCMEDRDSIIIDEEVFIHVDKNKLLELCKK